MRNLFCFLLFMFFFSGLQAQETDAETYEEEAEDASEYDGENEEATTEEQTHQVMAPEELRSTKEYQSGPVDLRKFDSRKWKEIAGTTDYNEKAPEKPKEEKGSENSLPSLPPWGGVVLRLIAYAVIAGVIILLLYLVIKNISFDVKLKKTKVTQEDFEAPVENIEEIDIELLLQQARSEGNYRLAVRLYYLGLLKKLNETGMIAWKKDKTNRDYLTELFQHEYHFDEIKQLTLSYEQVWYGEHGLTHDSFLRITSRFESVYKQMNTPSIQ
jgi:hypothetical protein